MTLQKEILGGKFKDGKLPSDRMLMRRFSVARETVRVAVNDLIKRRLVARQQGRGTFITRTAMLRKIGLIMPGVATSEFFQPIFATLTRLARGNDYELIFGEHFSSDRLRQRHEMRELAALLVRNRVAGVIFQPLDVATGDDESNQEILSLLDAKRIPVVLLDRDVVLPPERTLHDLVSINNEDAAERLVRHLVQSGARRICFLTNSWQVPNVARRLRGFLCAREMLGKRVRLDVLRGSPKDEALIGRWMRKRVRPDGIICDSDTTAAIVRQTLDRLGYAVPEDIMLAGFDDVRIAALMTPPLTTIHQPCEKIAEEVFRRLIARLGNPARPPTETFLYAPLVTRMSTDRNTFCENSKRKAKSK